MVQAFQDPPLCSSTVYTVTERREFRPLKLQEWRDIQHRILIDDRDWFHPYLVFNVERIEPLEQRMVEAESNSLVFPKNQKKCREKRNCEK
jgi:hypothetical protein